MQQTAPHRLIYKIESKILKHANWNLTLPLETAMRVCPETIVALSDSQCLRFIDEINGVRDLQEKVRALQNKIRKIKHKPKNPANRRLIEDYYQTLYNIQFQKDYVCVVMANDSDYDRANLGFSINYGLVDGKADIVHYRRFLGTNGGIKNSTIVYVNEKIYPELKKRLDNGRNLAQKFVPAKLEAYQSLICSGSVPLPLPKGFIVVKDCITRFKEDVILIDDSGEGEPKLTYEKQYEIEHNDSDGYGLMLPSYARKVNLALNGIDSPLSGMNTRFAWNKGMLYTMDFIEFAEKVAGSYYITDVWGDKRDVRDAEVILTESMLKLWAGYDSWESYYENCIKNSYQFSATKTAPDKLENVRNTNYQFLQSYSFTEDEINSLCEPTVREIKEVVGLDYRKAIAFLGGFGLDSDSFIKGNLENSVKALMICPDMIKDPYIQKTIYNRIRNRIIMGERGAISVNANYAMISGDPYALLQSMWGMEITGLLKKGEVYHKYWIDKGAKEIACFRAPMTCHNNIRKMKLRSDENTEHWYQYIKTALIYNAWDSACEAMNGADKDGDTNMCTDNPIILKNTLNSPTIICLQKNAEKIVPTEKDIIAANKLAFNDDIGVVTNYITSMIEVQSGFPVDSVEYQVLAYRIMCGQLYQQNTIDRAKGIISKPMPSTWYTYRDNKIKADDSEEIKQAKEFNIKIAATKKPYFMIYVYPRLKSELSTYKKNSDKNAIRNFSEYGVHSVQDIIDHPCPTDEMIQYYEYYKKLLPVGDNACIVNQIAWHFENEFNSLLTKMPNLIKQTYNTEFDYNILKCGVAYSNITYNKILKLYKLHNLQVNKVMQKGSEEKVDRFDNHMEYEILLNIFKSRCYEICSNREELCDIILDICYTHEKSKQFAWDICSDIMLENLLKKSGGNISFPTPSDDDYDFEYSGRKFKMVTINVSEVSE